MKPSGPGLLFVGSFSITDSILLLESGLLRFSVSSLFSLEDYVSRNLAHCGGAAQPQDWSRAVLNFGNK